jgi:hypothetical protein
MTTVLLSRSPGQVPRPAKRARTGVPVGRRTPRLPPPPAASSQEALLHTPPRATRSLTAEARSPLWEPSSTERRTLRPRDLSRSPLRDRAQRSEGGHPPRGRGATAVSGSPQKERGGSKAVVRPSGGEKHGRLNQIIEALEAAEEEEKLGRPKEGEGEGARAKSPPRKKAHALSKKARILSRMQAQRSVSSGEEKAGSQAELLEDNASSRRSRGGKAEEGGGEPRGGGGESEPEEDVPIMKRLDLASPQVSRHGQEGNSISLHPSICGSPQLEESKAHRPIQILGPLSLWRPRNGLQAWKSAGLRRFVVRRKTALPVKVVFSIDQPVASERIV